MTLQKKNMVILLSTAVKKQAIYNRA